MPNDDDFAGLDDILSDASTPENTVTLSTGVTLRVEYVTSEQMDRWRSETVEAAPKKPLTNAERQARWRARHKGSK